MSSSFLFINQESFNERIFDKPKIELEIFPERFVSHIPTENNQMMQPQHLQQLNEKKLCFLMSRSFRVGWGNNGVFAHPGKSFYQKVEKEQDDEQVEQQNNQKEKCNTIFIERVCIFSQKMRGFNDNQLQNTLDLHKNYFFASSNMNNLQWGNIFSKLFITSEESDFNPLNSDVNNENHSQIVNRLWSLCDILFGKIESKEEKLDKGEDYLSKMFRKENFEKWIVKTLEINSLSEPNPKNVLLFLLKNNIKSAVKMLFQLKDFRLASIVSQCASENIKTDLLETLNIWINNRFESKIDIHRLAIYKLLAGVYARGHRLDELSELVGFDIDWKTRLSIELWFSSPTDISRSSPVEDVFNSFDSSQLPSPPSYVEKDPSFYRSLLNRGGKSLPKDIFYHLLSFFSLYHKNSLLDSRKFRSFFNYDTVSSSPFDYSLPWMLFSFLYSIPHLKEMIPLSSDSLTLCINFSSQLEMMGQWGWSFYVLTWTLHTFKDTDFNPLLKVYLSNFTLRNAHKQNDQPNFDLYKKFQSFFPLLEDFSIEKVQNESLENLTKSECNIIEKISQFKDNFKDLNQILDLFEF